MNEETPKKYDAEDVANSLTGFDEIAIAKAFGKDIVDLQRSKSMTFGRALVFVLKRREGMKDGEAKQAVLDMTVGEVNDLFDDETDGADLDEADPKA